MDGHAATTRCVPVFVPAGILSAILCTKLYQHLYSTRIPAKRPYGMIELLESGALSVLYPMECGQRCENC
jgi:hypothetical protein